MMNEDLIVNGLNFMCLTLTFTKRSFFICLRPQEIFFFFSILLAPLLVMHTQNFDVFGLLMTQFG